MSLTGMLLRPNAVTTVAHHQASNANPLAYSRTRINRFDAQRPFRRSHSLVIRSSDSYLISASSAHRALKPRDGPDPGMPLVDNPDR